MNELTNLINPLNSAIIAEYLNNDSIFNTDSLQIKRLKYIIENDLTTNERIIFILYLESNFKVKEISKLLGCEASQVRNYIARVKAKIRNRYYGLNNNA